MQGEFSALSTDGSCPSPQKGRKSEEPVPCQGSTALWSRQPPSGRPPTLLAHTRPPLPATCRTFVPEISLWQIRDGVLHRCVLLALPDAPGRLRLPHRDTLLPMPVSPAAAASSPACSQQKTCCSNRLPTNLFLVHCHLRDLAPAGAAAGVLKPPASRSRPRWSWCSRRPCTMGKERIPHRSRSRSFSRAELRQPPCAGSSSQRRLAVGPATVGRLLSNNVN